MMDLRTGGFDWDEGNRAKCQKHGLSMAQIEALFACGPRIAPDRKHSADEDRSIAVGRIAGRPVFRGLHDPDPGQQDKDKRRFIRPVSARFMHAKEVAAYEEESAAIENG